MTDTATSPIKLDTGDAIAMSNQPENAARSGHNRRMTRPCNATKSVAWKREQLRSGKPPSAGLTFIVDEPNGECRFRESPVFPDKAAPKIDRRLPPIGIEADRQRGHVGRPVVAKFLQL